MEARIRNRWSKWVVGIAAASTLIGLVSPAGAQEADAVEASAGSPEVDAMANKGFSWQGWSDSRPISPQAGLPHELNPSLAPFTRAYVDSVPGGSAAFASLYYGDEIVEEGVLEIAPGGGVENPTLPRCGNPGNHGTGGTVEFGSGGVGAASTTDCSSQLRAFGISTFGPVHTDDLTVAGGFSQSESIMQEGLITGEVTSELNRVRAGDLAIDNIMSWIRVEYPAGQEPKISYRITASGVQSGGESAVEVGAPGWSFGGSDVPAGELVEQFNTQVNQAGAETAPEDQTWSVDFMAPRVYRPGDVPGRSFTDFSPISTSEILVYAPFLRIRTNQYHCCKNGNLENVGLHLAFSRVRLFIEATDPDFGNRVLENDFEADDQSPIKTAPESESPPSEDQPAAAPAPAPEQAPVAASVGEPAAAARRQLQARPVASNRESGAPGALVLTAVLVTAGAALMTAGSVRRRRGLVTPTR